MLAQCRCFFQIHHPNFVTLKKGTGQGWASISVNTVLPRWLCNTNRWTLFAAIQTNLSNTEFSQIISTIIKITQMKYDNICNQMFTLNSSISVRMWTFWRIVSNKGLLRWANDRQLLSVKYFSLWFETIIRRHLFIRVLLFHTQRTSLESLCDHQAWEYLRELFTTKAGFRHTLYKLNSNFDLEKRHK